MSALEKLLKLERADEDYKDEFLDEAEKELAALLECVEAMDAFLKKQSPEALQHDGNIVWMARAKAELDAAGGTHG